MTAQASTRYQSRCAHGGRPCPRVIQAVPLPSAEPRRPRWPSLVVAGFVLGVAVLEGLVPAVAGAIASVLP